MIKKKHINRAKYFPAIRLVTLKGIVNSHWKECGKKDYIHIVSGNGIYTGTSFIKSELERCIII